MVRSVSFVHSLLFDAQIAQSVEQRIENPCVLGSIPSLSTITQWCVSPYLLIDAQIAQSVEQRIENPCVLGSIPSLSTISFSSILSLSLSPDYKL